MAKSQIIPLADNQRWPTAPLHHIAEIFVGLPTARHVASEAEHAESLRVLSVGNIEDGRIVPREQIGTMRLRPGASARFLVRSGDVLVSGRGTALKIAPVRPEVEGIVASSNLIIIRSHGMVAPEILLALLRTSAWQEMLKLRTRSATGLMQLTARDLQDLPIPLLPPELQFYLVELINAEEQHYAASMEVAQKRRELVSEMVTRILVESHEGK